MPLSQETIELAHAVAEFTHDPLGFVLFAYPWGKVGTELENHKGPRKWQARRLAKIGEALRAGKINHWQAIRHVVASGHGIGKSALVGMVVNWAMSTREDTRGVITANTERQLRTKTWPEIMKWARLSVTSHWFKVEESSIQSVDEAHKKTWRFDLIPWSANNTEAFAGLHNQGKRLVVIFDEASSIDDAVWEVVEGALTDAETEMIFLAFGNPTRNIGRFKELFGESGNRWDREKIDSRTVEGTNLHEIAGWEADWGEDSDFFRIRVRGEFPRASEMQLIGTDLIAEAMKRPPYYTSGDPLIMSLDIARGGADDCVFAFRRGLDAKSIPCVRIPGAEVRDSMRLVAKAVDLIEQHKPDYFFYDGTGVGGPVGDRIRQLGFSVYEIQFGAASPNPKFANMRAYMYFQLRDWLQTGGAIEQNAKLAEELTSIEFTHNKKDQLILESKEHMRDHGKDSPDHADALAMSHALRVAPKGGPGHDFVSGTTFAKNEWNPFG